MVLALAFRTTPLPQSRILGRIYCLQEIRTQQEPQILPGYQHCWNHGQRNGYAGTAVLYKKEPLSVSFGLGDDDADEEGRTIILE